MQPSQKKLFLLDAMALIYRAYYALNKNPRINSKGQNTSAILGFTNSLYEIIKKEKPSHIAVAFDTFGPTLRQVDFADYKANRESTPEDIVQSLPYIRAIIEAFQIPILELMGYEADDIIGTIAKRAEKKTLRFIWLPLIKIMGNWFLTIFLCISPHIWGVVLAFWELRKFVKNIAYNIPNN